MTSNVLGNDTQLMNSRIKNINKDKEISKEV